MNTTTETTSCRIYVACLAAYNNGYLHGRWLDVPDTSDILWDGIKTMLDASPIPEAEEWAIHDYEGFGSLRLSEWESLDHICALAAFLSEHDTLGAAVLDHYDGDLKAATDALEDQHHGTYASLAEFGEVFLDETLKLPHAISHYIDYHAYARDMELSGDIFTIETAWDEVHIFWER